MKISTDVHMTESRLGGARESWRKQVEASLKLGTERLVALNIELFSRLTVNNANYLGVNAHLIDVSLRTELLKFHVVGKKLKFKQGKGERAVRAAEREVDLNLPKRPTFQPNVEAGLAPHRGFDQKFKKGGCHPTKDNRTVKDDQTSTRV